MVKPNYESRLGIPLKGTKLDLFTKSGTHILNGYNRVVVGERGPYIEFKHNDITDMELLKIPLDQIFRLYNDKVYYIEYRTIDSSNTKIYFQKRFVNYADYKLNMFYVSPFDMQLGSGAPVILTLKDLNKIKNQQ